MKNSDAGPPQSPLKSISEHLKAATQPVNFAAYYFSKDEADLTNNALTSFPDNFNTVSRPSLHSPSEMPVECLYGWLGHTARLLGAPLSWAYTSCLSIFAGQGIDLAEPDFPVRPTLYACLLGGPGDGKSVTISRAKSILAPSPEHVRTSTPASDRGLVCRINRSTGQAPDGTQGVVLILDELCDLLAKVNIQGSSLAPIFCKLFYEDVGGSADKTGLHEVNVRLSLIGALAVRDPTEFQALLGSGTTAGLYDRFVFAPGPKAWTWDRYWRAPDMLPRLPRATSMARPQHDRLTRWAEDKKAQGVILGRLVELAIRVALISASANHEDEVSDACITAAIHFAEWQYRVRGKYGPGEALNQDAQVSAAIIDAFFDEYHKCGRHDFLRWRTLANNKSFTRKFGSMTTRNRDALVAGGHLEAELGKNNRPTGYYRYVPEDQVSDGLAGAF